MSPRSAKIKNAMEVLHHRLACFPADEDARALRDRAVALLNVVQA